MENTQSVVAGFTAILDRDGLHAALAFLNARTRHRFTAVYRFDPPMLRSVCLYDRENPTLRVGADSLMRETYCSIVGDSERTFTTADALGDPRLASHPNRWDVQAYCGAPVVGPGDACIGSLCHFDARPRLLPETEIPVLESAGRVLAGWCSATAQSSASLSS